LVDASYPLQRHTLTVRQNSDCSKGGVSDGEAASNCCPVGTYQHPVLQGLGSRKGPGQRIASALFRARSIGSERHFLGFRALHQKPRLPKNHKVCTKITSSCLRALSGGIFGPG
jgi:hypothetical protein